MCWVLLAFSLSGCCVMDSKSGTALVNTVDPRYLDIDGTMEKI